MKRILILLSLFFCVHVSAQLETIENGESGLSARTKINAAIDQLNDTIDVDSVIINYKTGSLTDGAPTEAEITAIIGSPSSFNAGLTARIKDSDGTGLIYYLVTDGTNWYWIASTTAL